MASSGSRSLVFVSALVLGLVLLPAVGLAGPQLVVLNKAEATASVLDLESGEELARLSTGVGPHEVAVSPDARWAVVADYGAQTGGNTLTVIDLSSREVVRTIDLGRHARPHGIDFLPAAGPVGGEDRDAASSSRVLVTTEDSQHLLVVDVAAGKIVAEMPTGGRIGHMVARTPDATRAFVPHMGTADVAVFDLVKGERIALVKVGRQPEGIDVSPDGREVWVTNRGDDTVSVIDVASLEVLATFACGEFPIRLKFTPDGTQVLVSNARSGDVAVFDAASRKELARVAMDAPAVEDRDDRLFGDQFEDSPVPVGILVSPDGTVAWVANTNADVVTEIDLATREIRRRLVAGTEPDGLGYVPEVGR